MPREQRRYSQNEYRIRKLKSRVSLKKATKGKILDLKKKMYLNFKNLNQLNSTLEVTEKTVSKQPSLAVIFQPERERKGWVENEYSLKIFNKYV